MTETALKTAHGSRPPPAPLLQAPAPPGRRRSTDQTAPDFIEGLGRPEAPGRRGAEQECGSATSGVANFYCTDVVGGGCGGNVLAYTVPIQSYMVYCDLHFERPPARHGVVPRPGPGHDEYPRGHAPDADPGHRRSRLRLRCDPGSVCGPGAQHCRYLGLVCQCHLRQLLRKPGAL